MRRLIPGAIDLATLEASPASAGLDISWNACNPGVGRASDVTFPCDDLHGVAVLYGWFQPPVPMPAFIAMEAVVDLEAEPPALSSFWQLQWGG